MKTSIIIFSAAALLTLSACGNKKANTAASNNTEASSEQTPEQALECIYAKVLEDYSDENKGKDISDLDKYVSDDYKALQKQTSDKADKRGEIGPIDWDVWINAQDCQGLKLLGTSKVKDADGGVIMMVTLENCGEESDVYVKMSKEKGEWIISDFLYNWEDSLYSTASNMKQWLEE